MEIAYEEAESMLQKRIDENPVIKAFVADPTFKKTLAELVAFEEIDPSLLPTIEWEVLIVLGLYAPLSELAQNIHESTDLPIEKAEALCVMIESILLNTLYDELSAFDLFWKAELEKAESLPEAPQDFREKLELRPEGSPAVAIPTDSPKPLTRESRIGHSLMIGHPLGKADKVVSKIAERRGARQKPNPLAQSKRHHHVAGPFVSRLVFNAGVTGRTDQQHLPHRRPR